MGCTAQQRNGFEQVAEARYHSAADRVPVGHQSSRSSVGWQNIAVVAVASSNHLRCRVVDTGWGEGREEEPSILCQCTGGDRGCDAGGR